jgi:APA family basic amino acid/polyamine antiporter
VVLLVIVVGAFYINVKNDVPYIPPGEGAKSAASGVHQSLFTLVTGEVGSGYGWYGPSRPRAWSSSPS